MLFVLICPNYAISLASLRAKMGAAGEMVCWLSMLWTLMMNGLDLGPVGVALAFAYCPCLYQNFGRAIVLT
jgi:hypothetical protein